MLPMLKYLIPAVLMTAFLPGAVTAQETTTTVHVAYRDLDLRSAPGVHLFDRRIAKAIEQVCPEDVASSLSLKLLVARCRKAALAGVASQREAVLASAARHAVELAGR
jgi:UrcA family protein